MKILFVENHEAFLKIVIKQFLSEHEIKIAPNMSDAWNLFCAERFDIILMDYDLDDGKGSVLVERIRKTDPDIKIIAVSSHDDGNNALIKAGADLICSKVEFEKIDVVIGSLFK